MLKHPHQKLLTPAREAPRDAGFYQLPTAAIGADIVQGPIQSIAAGSAPYGSINVAQVTITAAPCGSSSLLGTQVEVYDLSGCIFDLPAADLIGAWVWASKGTSALNSSDCIYIAFNRCCVPEDSV